MANPLFSLDVIRVASPCDASWEAMRGDDRSRFCDGCEKHVYNLSAMTRPEAEALVREREGRLCVRFYRRADGTMLTADCPSGRWRRAGRFGRRAAFAAAALFAASTGTACASAGPASAAAGGGFTQTLPRWVVKLFAWVPGSHAVTPPITGTPAPPVLMGAIAPTAPPIMGKPAPPPQGAMGEMAAPTE